MTGLAICYKCGGWSADPCTFCGTTRPPGTGPGYQTKKADARCSLQATGGQRCALRHGHGGACVASIAEVWT